MFSAALKSDQPRRPTASFSDNRAVLLLVGLPFSTSKGKRSNYTCGFGSTTGRTICTIDRGNQPSDVTVDGRTEDASSVKRWLF